MLLDAHWPSGYHVGRTSRAWLVEHDQKVTPGAGGPKHEQSSPAVGIIDGEYGAYLDDMAEAGEPIPAPISSTGLVEVA